MRAFPFALVLVALAACGGGAGTDAGPADLGGDGAPADAADGGARDAALDGTLDAGPGDGGGSDLGGDAGAPATCTTSADCAGATPACDAAAHACVRCRSDGDCGGLFCDPASGECRDCVTDAQCTDPALPICDATSRQCSAHCTSDADCPAHPGRCHPTLHVCLDCIGNGMPCTFCETGTYSCVGCVVDGDCASGETCGPSHECTSHCDTSATCGPLVCDPALHACVECATNADCGGGICQVDHTCG